MKITVIGNPENRRVTMFADAVRAAGDECVVIAWLDLLRDEREFPGELVRIESPGENWAVESALLGVDEPEDRGRIRGLETAHRRFTQVLDSLRSARCMNSPSAIAAMFDKVESKRLLEAAGVDVPRTFGLVRRFEELRAVAQSTGRNRFFVKPRHGSSASGVIALSIRSDKVLAVTSVERADNRLYNSLKIRRYHTFDDVERVVDLLGAEDELLVEEWVPKASMQRGCFDLRVVAIGDRAEHAVMRVSKSPMTNLHLGNRRGDLAELRETLGERWSAVEATAVRALGAFDGALYAGVDIGLTPDHRRITTFEANAFGDLLPGVVDAGGRDCYAAEIAAFKTRNEASL